MKVKMTEDQFLKEVQKAFNQISNTKNADETVELIYNMDADIAKAVLAMVIERVRKATGGVV